MELKVTQQLPITVKAEDKFGNPTGSFDAPPAWSLSDPALASMTVAEDGLSATFIPAGKAAQVQVKAQAQVAGKALEGSLDIDLKAGEAVTLTLEAGQPQDAPQA